MCSTVQCYTCRGGFPLHRLCRQSSIPSLPCRWRGVPVPELDAAEYTVRVHGRLLRLCGRKSGPTHVRRLPCPGAFPPSDVPSEYSERPSTHSHAQHACLLWSPKAKMGHGLHLLQRPPSVSEATPVGCPSGNSLHPLSVPCLERAYIVFGCFVRAEGSGVGSPPQPVPCTVNSPFGPPLSPLSCLVSCSREGCITHLACHLRMFTIKVVVTVSSANRVAG